MSDSYFIKRGESLNGPFTLKKVQKALSDKKLKAGDLIAVSKGGPWVPLSSVYKEIGAGKAPRIADEKPDAESIVDEWTTDDEQPPSATQPETIESAEKDQPSITSSAVSEAESIKAPTRRGVWVLLLVVSGFFSLASGFGILDNLGAFESQAVRDAVAESDRLEAEFYDNYESNARGARNAMYDVTGRSGGLVGAVEGLRDTVDEAADSAYVQRQQERTRQQRDAESDTRNERVSRSVMLFLVAISAFCFSASKLFGPFLSQKTNGSA